MSEEGKTSYTVLHIIGLGIIAAALYGLLFNKLGAKWVIVSALFVSAIYVIGMLAYQSNNGWNWRIIAIIPAILFIGLYLVTSFYSPDVQRIKFDYYVDCATDFCQSRNQFPWSGYQTDGANYMYPKATVKCETPKGDVKEFGFDVDKLCGPKPACRFPGWKNYLDHSCFI